MRLILLLALLLAGCSTQVPTPAPLPIAADATSKPLPPELQRCLDFTRRIDAIERRFLPPGAREGDPVATLLAFVERESGRSVVVGDGCAIDANAARAALDAIDHGPAAVRGVLDITLRDAEPPLAWITDGGRLHLVHERDVDLLLKRLPESEATRTVRNRLCVEWTAVVDDPAALESNDGSVLVRGRLAWLDDDGSSRPIACSLLVVVQVALDDSIELRPCPWDVSRSLDVHFGTDLSRFVFDDQSTRTHRIVETDSAPDGTLSWTIGAPMFADRSVGPTERAVVVWLPCADSVVAGRVRARIRSTPRTLRLP
ncbi:MAG: hypothetical protein IPJ77_07140 [Planctomycetes bacterium]|nr:hypothetical protein [Planctomycetota bacterium]